MLCFRKAAGLVCWDWETNSITRSRWFNISRQKNCSTNTGPWGGNVS